MTDIQSLPPKVAEAVVKVMGEVGYVQKKGTNTFHNYKFAAMGDVLEKLQPAMHEAGLLIAQDEVSREVLADAAMTATYQFVLSHSSGETWQHFPRHTGMAAFRTTKGTIDDKALNKCHTAARKYFLLSLFQIPTGEAVDPDEDGDVPEKTSGKTFVKPSIEPSPAEKKAQEIQQRGRAAKDEAALEKIWADNKAHIDAFNDQLRNQTISIFAGCRKAIRQRKAA
jgi:hypothetical protein